MAGNERINGYLEAILESEGARAGAGARDEKLPCTMNFRERGNFNLTKYILGRNCNWC